MHLDNYGDCRILHGQNWFERFLRVRPRCVLMRQMPPRDGEWTCDDQEPYPRPPGPPPPPHKD
jgi:hypothetical protein